MRDQQLPSYFKTHLCFFLQADLALWLFVPLNFLLCVNTLPSNEICPFCIIHLINCHFFFMLFIVGFYMQKLLFYVVVPFMVSGTCVFRQACVGRQACVAVVTPFCPWATVGLGCGSTEEWAASQNREC